MRVRTAFSRAWVISFSSLGLACLCAIFSPVIFHAASPSIARTAGSPGSSGYHLVQTYKLGGSEGWDYLAIDSDARRLYISRSTHVMIVDADTGKVVGDVPDTPGVHGIALIPSLIRGFTSNGRAGSVTMFSLLSLAVGGKFVTGQNPDAIVYDPASNLIFTMNGGSNDSTAIDPIAGSVSGTIPLDGKPEFAVADGTGYVYVNIEDAAIMDQIDSQGLRVRRRWQMKPCESPTGLSMDRVHRRLFAGCGNQKMLVMNADNGEVVATLPIGRGVDATAFDPSTGFAFASNGADGTLTVIHEDSPAKFSVVENVETQRGARTMALDEKTHNVYLVTASFAASPEPTKDNPRPRPPMLPDSFVLLVYGR